MHHFQDLKPPRGAHALQGEAPFLCIAHVCCNLGTTYLSLPRCGYPWLSLGLAPTPGPETPSLHDASQQLLLLLQPWQHLGSSLLPPTGPQQLLVGTGKSTNSLGGDPWAPPVQISVGSTQQSGSGRHPNSPSAPTELPHQRPGGPVASSSPLSTFVPAEERCLALRPVPTLQVTPHPGVAPGVV